MVENRFVYLLDRFYNDTISEEQLKELLPLLTQAENEEVVKGQMDNSWQTFSNSHNFFTPIQSQRILNFILKGRIQAVVKKGIYRVAVAAALGCFFVGVIHLWSTYRQSKATALSNTSLKTAIVPGKSGAVLVLADGTKVVLNKDSSAKIRLANGAAVIDKNCVSFVGAQGSKDLKFGSLITQKGEQFSLVLSDGTKVWLNAASSIRFPMAFIGNERDVEITGEAYFEVAKNPAKPFRVLVNGMQVEVLGTHFNIEAYGDASSTKTTLLEGAVKLTKGKMIQFLRPNQQAILDKGGEHLRVVEDPEAEEAIAWKDGNFLFNDANLKDVILQIARWYNVNVEFEGDLKQRRFSGKVSRSVDFKEILSMLSYANVDCSVNGNNLIVRP